jgi:hypothetical protein
MTIMEVMIWKKVTVANFNVFSCRDENNQTGFHAVTGPSRIQTTFQSAQTLLLSHVSHGLLYHRAGLHVSHEVHYRSMQSPRWSSSIVRAIRPMVRRVLTRPRTTGFLRAMKIRSTTSSGREVKPFIPCRRFTAC